MPGHLLVERYALSMDAIEIRTARCVQVTVPPATDRWLRAGDCPLLRLQGSRCGGTSKPDGRAVSTETATFRQLKPRLHGVRLRRASASFRHGVVARVSDRLDAMHRARHATMRAPRRHRRRDQRR
jgi:hypothetical protein